MYKNKQKKTRKRKKWLKCSKNRCIMNMDNMNIRRFFKRVATLVKRAEKNINYSKPNLNNLKGKKGKALLKFVSKLPDPSTEQLSKDVKNYIETALRGKKR